MTILLYDYKELEEKASKHLRVWKAWHTTLFILAAIFGILNYTFLQNTTELVDNNCVLYPRTLEFVWVDIPEVSANPSEVTYAPVTNVTSNDNTTTKLPNGVTERTEDTPTEAQNITETVPTENVTEKANTVKREAVDADREETIEYNNTIISENATHRLVLDTSRTLFGDCQFAEYMPLLSSVFALVWSTLFIICPSGGRARTGLQQPWRILTPALFFTIVMVALTGHSFTSTNSGLHAFCASFINYTNSTTCSSVNPFIYKSWNASWNFGARAATTRAVSAGVWVSWACSAALLLARCLAAPDFAVRKTSAYLKDPQQKVAPHIKPKKSPRRSTRLPHQSPKRDAISVKSEPTVTTELVSASVEHGPDSDPTSLNSTPLKTQRREINEDLEMTYNPQELGFGDRR